MANSRQSCWSSFQNADRAARAAWREQHSKRRVILSGRQTHHEGNARRRCSDKTIPILTLVGSSRSVPVCFSEVSVLRFVSRYVGQTQRQPAGRRHQDDDAGSRGRKLVQSHSLYDVWFFPVFNEKAELLPVASKKNWSRAPFNFYQGEAKRPSLLHQLPRTTHLPRNKESKRSTPQVSPL
jgi:hypothetical protein